MCWNVEVSAAAATFAWAVCLYLLRRGGPRDSWYARYLFTFTFTQLIDIVFWSMHEKQPYVFLRDLHIPGGLVACKDIQASWAFPTDANPQWPNFVMTKYVIPTIVFSQYAMQCTYPSAVFSKRGQRQMLIGMHVIPSAIMSFFFACSITTPSLWPVPKDTMQWGGDFGWSMAGVARGEGVGTFWVNQFFAFLASVHVGVLFWLLCPRRVFVMHALTLALVLVFQTMTEGTITMGSKWCTYCLIYSIVYITDPLWMPKAVKPSRGETDNSEDRSMKGASADLRRRKIPGVGGQ